MHFERTLPSCTRALAVTALILVGTAALAQAPMKVGELEPVSLATAHPYPAGSGANAQQWIVSYPDATYIRVHFSRFDLAPGDTVQISDAAGNESFVFEGQGPHGDGSFRPPTGAASVSRSTASGGALRPGSTPAIRGCPAATPARTASAASTTGRMSSATRTATRTSIRAPARR